ncbi:MAG TPA: hypothetical protein VFM04_03765 [Candidatus Methylomirabilis sp.]|nr:hypothetical protein [Candidatus Methylomirabilis sp.]
MARADGSARQQLTVTPLVAEQWPRWVAPDRMVVIRGQHRMVQLTRSNPIPFLSDRTDEVVLHLTTPRAMMNIRQAAVAQR